MKYIISYDLNKPGQHYQVLWDTLRRMGAKKVLDSQWCLRRTGTNAEKLCDYLWKLTDSNDRLLVTELDGADWCSYRLINSPNDI